MLISCIKLDHALYSINYGTLLPFAAATFAVVSAALLVLVLLPLFL